jgi:hypothetical protein
MYIHVCIGQSKWRPMNQSLIRYPFTLFGARKKERR